MSKEIKIYIPEYSAGDHTYTTFLPKSRRVDNMSEADIVIFTGGEDVHPSFYNQTKLPRTYSNIKRDTKEMLAYIKALELKKPMLGICRGAQFLTVMNGGMLIQHVDSHSGDHEIELLYDPQGVVETLKMTVSSTHHQMMCPMATLKEDEYTVIGWNAGLPSSEYVSEIDGKNADIKDKMIQWSADMYEVEENFIIEPEIVFYNKSNCLCMQFHPEYYHFKDLKTADGRKSIDIVHDLINQYLLNVKSKTEV